MQTVLGLVCSALPKLVHAHAKHVLTNPALPRGGIALYSHQLIASKTVPFFSLSLPFYTELVTAARGAVGPTTLYPARRSTGRDDRKLERMVRSKGSRRVDPKRRRRS